MYNVFKIIRHLPGIKTRARTDMKRRMIPLKRGQAKLPIEANYQRLEKRGKWIAVVVDPGKFIIIDNYITSISME